jgi:hypothetical protein
MRQACGACHVTRAAPSGIHTKPETVSHISERGSTQARRPASRTVEPSDGSSPTRGARDCSSNIAGSLYRRSVAIDEQLGYTGLGEYRSLPLDGYLAQRMFHRINISQPRLQLVHQSPDVFLVPEFLSQSECRELIAMHGTAETRGASATSSEQSEMRTSTTVLPPPEDVLITKVRKRIAEMANVAVAQLDTTKITHYAHGQHFGPHVDTASKAYGIAKHDRWQQLVSMGLRTPEAREQFNAVFDGPTCVGICPDRFCSVFIYLNDVAQGGRTTFSKVQDGHVVREMGDAIDSLRGTTGPTHTPVAGGHQHPLRIEPRAGMACIHFPTTVPSYRCLADFSTTHESEAAISPKYIVQQCAAHVRACGRPTTAC